MDDITVSVVIPYVQEYPQIAFTIRAVHTELAGVPHEIVAVDNMCKQALMQQWGLGHGTVADFEALSRQDRMMLYAERMKEGHLRPLDKGHRRPKAEKKPPYDRRPPTLEDYYGEKIELADSTIKSWADHNPWLTYVQYEDKLSHWNAKNTAVAVARGRLLFFVDGHVAPGDGCLRNAVKLYDEWTAEHGPGCFHTPLTYHILEDKKLVYAFRPELEKWFLGYRFCSYPKTWDDDGTRIFRAEHGDFLPEPQEVPCGSLCGMLTSRELYDRMGGFPKALGIYGGGENFWNFTRATLGAKAWVVPGEPLYHHGATRGYHWLDGDFKKNQAVAAFLYGGEEWLEGFCRHHDKYERDRDFFERILTEIPVECAEHRAHIAGQQTKELDEWIAENSPST